MSTTLQETFLARGATPETVTHMRFVSGHEVLLVTEGSTDIFLCQLEDGKPGRRVFLYQAGPGPALVIGQTAEEGLAILATTLGPAKVLALDQSEMPSLMTESSKELRPLLEQWLTVLTPAVVDAPLPILARAVAPGQKLEAKAADRYYPRLPVVIDVQSGSVLLVDKRPISGANLLPLLPTTWLTTEKDCVFEVLDFGNAMTRENAWTSLRYYGEQIVSLVAAARQRFSAIEKERIRARAEVDTAIQRSGWKQMAGVLSHEKPGEVVYSTASVEPLLACCQKIGKNMGVPVSAPSRTSANDPLDDIARVSNLRVRRVNLRGRWWQMDGGPLVGWMKDDGRPVALVVPRAGVYMLHDPESDKVERVDAGVADRLRPRAAMFYRRLPDRAIGLKELFSLALLGSKRDFFALLALAAVAGVLALATPVGTKLLFDEVLPLGEKTYLQQLMSGLLIVMVCNIFFTLAYSVALVRFGGRFGSDLATSMFDRLLTLPMPFFRSYAIGDLAQRSLGITRIRDLVTGGTLTKIITSVFALTSYLLLLYYDLRLGLIAGGLLLVNLVFSLQTGFTQLALRRKAADLSGQVNGILFQILGGLPKLRVAGAESRFFSYWATRFAAQMDYEYRAGSLAVIVSVFNTGFPVLSTFLIFAFIGLSLDPIPTGTLLGFMAAYAQCTAAIAALSESATEVSAALPQLERTGPILAAVPEKDDQKIDPGELSGAIELANVCFRYQTDQNMILSKVSIKVEPREFIALVGGTGAGKSTVLNLLLGFDAPESGSVFFDGKDLSMLDVQGVRQQIGVVLQNGRIVKDTVYRNVASGRPISSEQTWEALRMVGLDTDVEAMPMGLDTVISPETFSGGQAQRLLIARAIVSRPRIIFFDEATSALDNKTQAIVSASLEHLNAARVVIAHRLSTIRNADRIYVMSGGEVVQVGSYDDLCAVPGLFAELMARQQDTR